MEFCNDVLNFVFLDTLFDGVAQCHHLSTSRSPAGCLTFYDFGDLQQIVVLGREKNAAVARERVWIEIVIPSNERSRSPLMYFFVR